MNIITIDCGASFIKAALVINGKKERNIRVQAPGVALDPLSSTDKIIHLCETVEKILSEFCDGLNECVLCISNEMHGFVITDKDGSPVTDYISWQTDFGDRSLLNAPEVQDLVIRTGMPFRGGLPSSNLSWFLNNCKHDGNIYFYTLGDYLIRFLSGKDPKIHPTNAAATGLYDITDSKWSSGIISYIGATDVLFPTVSSEATEFMLDNVKVTALPAIGDQQAALLGAGLSGMDTISFNMGTGAQVSRLSGEISYDEKWQLRPFFNGKYLVTIPHIPSGRALNVYFRFIKSVLETYNVNIGDEEIWRGIFDSCNADNEWFLKLDMGFFENAITDSVKGSIGNIDERNFTMANLFSSVIMQMTENFCTAADRIWPERENVKKVLFSGGVSERFTELRDGISGHYKGAQSLYSTGDTMEGLLRYADGYFMGDNA